MSEARCGGNTTSDLPRRLRIRAGWALALAFLLPLAGCDPETGTPPRPVRNVVLVSLDTLRPDHLGLYGYERDTSPKLDAFSREGFVFERALAPAPNTPASQMAMMTGLTPGRHGFTGNDDALAPGIETLALRLKRAGLQTAGFVDGGYLRAVYGFDRGFDRYYDAGGGFAEILPRALRWLDRHGERPFFLFLHTYDIHAPYVSPPPFAGMFHEEPYTGDLVPTGKRLETIWREEIALSDAEMQHLVDSYDEGIRYTDERLGAFLRRLEARGRLEDTAVIVSSDHGEEFGEHGSILHWQLYFQPNLRVPLIVRLPGGVEGPVRLAAQAQLIDLLPTVLELVGAEPLAAAQGRSLVPRLTSAPAGEGPSERAAFAWWPQPGQVPLRSLVLGDRQLIFDELRPGRDELYDLAADPMAQRDLAAERPEEVARLREIGLRGMRENRPIHGERTRPEVEIDRKTREQLEALGYQR